MKLRSIGKKVKERVINEWYAPVKEEARNPKPDLSDGKAGVRKENEGRRQEYRNVKIEPRIEIPRPQIKVEAKVEPKKETISLNTLNQDNRRKDKGPTEKNMNALKEALSKLQVVPKNTAINTANFVKPLEQKKEIPLPSPPKPKVNEVPEDVLRGVLRGS